MPRNFIFWGTSVSGPRVDQPATGTGDVIGQNRDKGLVQEAADEKCKDEFANGDMRKKFHVTLQNRLIYKVINCVEVGRSDDRETKKPVQLDRFPGAT